MPSIVNSLWVSPFLALNSDIRPRSRVKVRSVGSEDSAVLSSEPVKVNGVSFVGEERIGGLVYRGNGGLVSSVGEKKKTNGGNVVLKKLEPLWDDGYGDQTVKDYLDLAKDIIKPDGGPPRWFCPVPCGPPLKDSPVLLFLPGNLCSRTCLALSARLVPDFVWS